MKKKILMLLIVIASVFTIQVNARQFYTSEKVIIKDHQETSVFAAGDEVKTKSFIDGSTFIAGLDVEISSSQDVLFVAGEEIKIKGAYTKDAFLAGTEIEIETSEIRDLFAFAEDIEIKSPISHNAYVAGTKVLIDSEIMGNLNIAAEKIVITENAKINGTLNYPENARITISDEAVIKNSKTYTADEEEQITTNVMTKIEDLMISYISILLVGFIMLTLFKKIFEKIEKEELSINNVAKKTALGLVTLIVVPVIVAIGLISLVGIPMSLILLALYIIAIYVSIIPSGYFFASKLLKDKIKNEHALLAIGVAVIKLLEFVPVIGGIVVFISLCLGLNLMFNYRKNPAKQK